MNSLPARRHAGREAFTSCFLSTLITGELIKDGADAMNAQFPFEPLYIPPPEHTRHVTPEKRLMVAVLEEALQILKRGEQNNRKPFGEAQEWLMSEGMAGLFSYRNICDVLDLDADRIRCLFVPDDRSDRDAVIAPLDRGLRSASNGGKDGREERRSERVVDHGHREGHQGPVRRRARAGAGSARAEDAAGGCAAAAQAGGDRGLARPERRVRDPHRAGE